MSIRIEKGIPLPRRNRHYPWKKMQIGDSFAVPAADKPHGVQTTQPGKTTGFKFECHKTTEGTPPQEVWRVWRTA